MRSGSPATPVNILHAREQLRECTYCTVLYYVSTYVLDLESSAGWSRGSNLYGVEVKINIQYCLLYFTFVLLILPTSVQKVHQQSTCLIMDITEARQQFRHTTPCFFASRVARTRSKHQGHTSKQSCCFIQALYSWGCGVPHRDDKYYWQLAAVGKCCVVGG